MIDAISMAMENAVSLYLAIAAWFVLLGIVLFGSKKL